MAWGLKVFVQPLATPPQALVVDAAGAVRGDLTRLLGADAAPAQAAAPPAPATDARFRLVGVVSPRAAKAANEGLALIAVDGKPPRAYRIGAVVEGPNVLQAVSARGAMLGPRDGAAVIALKLPPPAPAATGVLPSVSARGNDAPPPPPMAAPAAVPPSALNAVDQDEPEPPPPPEQNGRAPLR